MSCDFHTVTRSVQNSPSRSAKTVWLGRLLRFKKFHASGCYRGAWLRKQAYILEHSDDRVLRCQVSPSYEIDGVH